ncbi:hypothetical protein KIF59_12190 [Enterobacter cloacae subsp. cloacae]|nr:hypothetical protein [Enterobacter cloacae subsp. cloacae]
MLDGYARAIQPCLTFTSARLLGAEHRLCHHNQARATREKSLCAHHGERIFLA